MESSVKLIEKSIKLNFEKHISNICKKASQPTISNLQTANMGHKKKKQW